MKIMHDARHGIKNVRILQAIHAPTSLCGGPSVLTLTQKVREGRIALVHVRIRETYARERHRKGKTDRRAGETHAFAIAIVHEFRGFIFYSAKRIREING